MPQRTQFYHDPPHSESYDDFHQYWQEVKARWVKGYVAPQDIAWLMSMMERFDNLWHDTHHL